MIDPLLTVEQLCEIFTIKPGTIHTSRLRGGHPLFDKGFCPLGVRAGLRFRQSDVQDYIDMMADARTSRRVSS
ncbi:hypothetical protein QNA23_10545 [Rhodococcus erythropolis]|uniref:hypothetical protein n=1 Tax=Rhodococcus erythropolis TaxID=1833 RepID=UPI0024B9D244|nr:hypothetical protein [Rhodococcus erythropolis]MDJ0403920.1 hypothetical protein [Rhodococcus erythropolis]